MGSGPAGILALRHACTAVVHCLLDCRCCCCDPSETCGLSLLTRHAVAPNSACHAGLHSLDLSGNRFACLPPALSTATSLTRLALNGSHSMRLTEADTAVLLALPHLQQLEIEGVAAADADLLHEWQLRMPGLQIAPMPA